MEDKLDASTDNQNSFKAAVFALVFLSVLAFVFHYVVWGAYLHVDKPSPYLGELPSIWGNDLARLMALCADFSPYQKIREVFPFEAVPYPPTAFVVHGLLAKIGGVGALLVFYAVFAVGYCRLVWLYSVGLAFWDRLLVCLAFTFGVFPFYYVLDRANFDGIVTVLLGTALYLYEKKAQGRNLGAILLIAVAGALKIYPLFFALIFLVHRNIRAFLLCGLACAGLTLFSMLMLDGSLFDQVQGFLGELKFTNACYQSYDSCLNLGFLYPIKAVVHALLGVTSSAWVFQAAYLFSVLLLLSGVACLFWFLRPDYPIAVSLLAITSIWIPTMSFDYKLLLLVPPILMLLKDSRPSYLLLALLFGFALASKRALGAGNEMHYNHIALCAAFVLSLVLSHPRGIALVDLYACRINKKVLVLFLVAFGLMYVVPTARLFWVPGMRGDVHVTMSRKDPPGTYGAGWSGYDGDGKSTWRWTAGCEGEIHLRLRPEATTRMTVGVQTHRANHQQVLRIYYNGTKVGEMELAEGQAKEMRFDIPKELIPQQAILPDRLVFKTSACLSPSGQVQNPLGVSVSHIDGVVLP